jgi:chromosome segregation ATPase
MLPQHKLLQLRAELAAVHRELEAARREAAAAVTQADVSQQRARHLESENATVVRRCSLEDRRLSQWSDELSALQSRLNERARDLEQVRLAVC